MAPKKLKKKHCQRACGHLSPIFCTSFSIWFSSHFGEIEFWANWALVSPERIHWASQFFSCPFPPLPSPPNQTPFLSIFSLIFHSPFSILSKIILSKHTQSVYLGLDYKPIYCFFFLTICRSHVNSLLNSFNFYFLFTTFNKIFFSKILDKLFSKERHLNKYHSHANLLLVAKQSIIDKIQQLLVSFARPSCSFMPPLQLPHILDIVYLWTYIYIGCNVWVMLKEKKKKKEGIK